MLLVKVSVTVNNGNRKLIAEDKVVNAQCACTSIVGFVTWFVSTYAKNELVNIHTALSKLSPSDIRATSVAINVFKYKTSNVSVTVSVKAI